MIRNEVLRYDPEGGNVRIMDARLPEPKYHTSAVWTGKKAYVFGGRNETAVVDEILEFDPGSDEVSVFSKRLPSGRERTSAVWTGEHAYIFGGQAGAVYLDEILRLDPESEKDAGDTELFL
jgi:N-acetylneuraminic acid mutarotase